MRISDWSSDVCSSDLRRLHVEQLHRRAQQRRGIPQLHRTHRVQMMQQLADAAVRPTQHRATDRQRFEHGATERLGLVRQLQHQCTDRVQLAQIVALRSNGKVRSEEHTSELQSLMRISYAVFCLKKKKKHTNDQQLIQI